MKPESRWIINSVQSWQSKQMISLILFATHIHRQKRTQTTVDIINSAPSWQKSKQMICFVLFATHMKRQKRTQTTVSFAQCNLGRVTKQMISEHTLCLISWHWPDNRFATQKGTQKKTSNIGRLISEIASSSNNSC